MKIMMINMIKIIIITMNFNKAIKIIIIIMTIKLFKKIILTIPQRK